MHNLEAWRMRRTKFSEILRYKSHYLGQTTRPSDSKKNLSYSGLYGPRVKLKESEKRDKYLDLARELKKPMKHEGDGETNYNCCTRNNPQRIGKGTRILGNKRTRGNHPDYIIIKIYQNTENNSLDLKRLAVTQTRVENQQLTLVWKTPKGIVINNFVVPLVRYSGQFLKWTKAEQMDPRTRIMTIKKASLPRDDINRLYVSKKKKKERKKMTRQPWW